jgi:[acyl-carrier-protein] S-malonyltransferase
MQEAVPAGVGAMAAILGLDAEVIEKSCEIITNASEDFCVEVANFNGPDQTVISGTLLGVEKAISVLKEKGAKRAMTLQVSAPFHCRLMNPAAQKLATHLETVEFAAPKYAFMNNVEAQLEAKPERIRDLLIKQVTAPVRFTSMLTRLKESGANNYIEIGPGKVLSGIVRRTLSDVIATSKEI